MKALYEAPSVGRRAQSGAFSGESIVGGWYRGARVLAAAIADSMNRVTESPLFMHPSNAASIGASHCSTSRVMRVSRLAAPCDDALRQCGEYSAFGNRQQPTNQCLLNDVDSMVRTARGIGDQRSPRRVRSIAQQFSLLVDREDVSDGGAQMVTRTICWEL